MTNGYTPTEYRILNLLKDGLPHHKTEVHKCLYDELSQLDSLAPHICRLRAKLLQRGETVVAVIRNKTTFYQHFRLLYSANDGRT